LFEIFFHLHFFIDIDPKKIKKDDISKYFNYISTIGVDIFLKDIERTRLKFMDSSGQSKYKTTPKKQFESSDAIIFIFDV
jgi:hypothetical protein